MTESPPYSNAAVVMGVTCCGKTTVGETLARLLGVAFVEGDKLHDAANIAKMSAGTPLTDADRWPWLIRIGAALQGPEGCIASCSALRKVYRETITKAAGRPVSFVHLHGSESVLRQRIAARKGHFMPPSLLASQIATLETPSAGELAMTIDIDDAPERIVERARQFLRESVA